MLNEHYKKTINIVNVLSDNSKNAYLLSFHEKKNIFFLFFSFFSLEISFVSKLLIS